MHNIPFIAGGIDNLSRDSRSISRDVRVVVTKNERHARLTDYRATNYQFRQL